MLTIDQLSVTYRDGDHSLLALDQVSLALEAGRITALAGESGSGKTTLGKSLMGLLAENAQVEGSIKVGDAFYRVMHAHPHGKDLARKHIHVAAPGSHHENGHGVESACLFEPRCTQSTGECREGPVSLSVVENHQIRCVRGGIVSLLELEGVSKRYGRVMALRPIDLRLRAGEVFCVVGETGSGKTTLAMIASGVLAQDRGRRIFENQDMDRWIREDYKSLAGRVGVIYQNPAEAVSHRLSVFDIVAEPLRVQGRLQGKSDIHHRVKLALADVRLSTEPEFLKRYPHELNMGAIQRVCIARAIVVTPSFLVADEPTSALDPSVQAKVLKMLLDLQVEKGLTMLFVTHDIGLARKIGDRIGVMLAGRLVEIGPLDRVMESPRHPYTKRLMECAAGRGEHIGFGLEPSVPEGCAFACRCSQATDICMKESPPAVAVDWGQHVTWCRFPNSCAS